MSCSFLIECADYCHHQWLNCVEGIVDQSQMDILLILSALLSDFMFFTCLNDNMTLKMTINRPTAASYASTGSKSVSMSHI